MISAEHSTVGFGSTRNIPFHFLLHSPCPGVAGLLCSEGIREVIVKTPKARKREEQNLGFGTPSLGFIGHGIGSFFFAICISLSCEVRKTCAARKGLNTPSHNLRQPPKGKEITRLVAGNGLGTSAISLLCNGKLDTLALWQGDPRLLRANDEDVALTGSERVVYGILDVDNVEASIVTLTVGDDTNTSHVTTTSRHGDDTSIELDELGDLASGEVNLDGIVDLDGWVGVSDTKGRTSLAFLEFGIATVDPAPISRGSTTAWTNG